MKRCKESTGGIGRGSAIPYPEYLDDAALDDIAERLQFLIEKYDPCDGLAWGEMTDHQKEIFRAVARGIAVDFYDLFHREPTIA